MLRQPFRASAPPTISISSVVMDSWRKRLCFQGQFVDHLFRVRGRRFHSRHSCPVLARHRVKKARVDLHLYIARKNSLRATPLPTARTRYSLSSFPARLLPAFDRQKSLQRRDLRNSSAKAVVKKINFLVLSGSKLSRRLHDNLSRKIETDLVHHVDELFRLCLPDACEIVISLAAHLDEIHLDALGLHFL